MARFLRTRNVITRAQENEAKRKSSGTDFMRRSFLQFSIGALPALATAPAMQAAAAERNGKPFDTAVAALAAQGVQFRVCGNTLAAHEIPQSQLLPQAKLVPSGVVEVARLQAREGYVYLRP